MSVTGNIMAEEIVISDDSSDEREIISNEAKDNTLMTKVYQTIANLNGLSAESSRNLNSPEDIKILFDESSMDVTLEKKFTNNGSSSQISLNEIVQSEVEHQNEKIQNLPNGQYHFSLMKYSTSNLRKDKPKTFTILPKESVHILPAQKNHTRVAANNFEAVKKNIDYNQDWSKYGGYCKVKCTLCKYSRESKDPPPSQWCNECGESLTFMCLICDCEFKSWNVFKPHMEFIHYEKLSCPYCDFKATLKKHLHEHITSRHNDYLQEKHVCQIIFETQKDDSLSYAKICPKCDKPDYFNKLKQQRNCWECNVPFIFLCLKCGHCTTTATTRTYHMEVCPENKRTYRCNKCHFTHTKRQGLTRHMRLKHCGDVQPCWKCRKLYDTRYLKIHLPKCLKGIRNCQYCSKDIRYKTHFVEHLKTVHELSLAESIKVMEETYRENKNSQASNQEIVKYCPKCDKTIEAMRMEHEFCEKCKGKLRIQCLLCSKRFIGMEFAQRHLKRICSKDSVQSDELELSELSEVQDMAQSETMNEDYKNDFEIVVFNENGDGAGIDDLNLDDYEIVIPDTADDEC